MARLKRVNTRERRTARRVPASEVVPEGLMQLATGQEVKLVNISLNGAVLVHSDILLSPGSVVRLRLRLQGRLINMDGRIERCRVIALGQEQVRYEAAVALQNGLPSEITERLQFIDVENPQPLLEEIDGTDSDDLSTLGMAQIFLVKTSEERPGF